MTDFNFARLYGQHFYVSVTAVDAQALEKILAELNALNFVVGSCAVTVHSIQGFGDLAEKQVVIEVSGDLIRDVLLERTADDELLKNSLIGAKALKLIEQLKIVHNSIRKDD